MNVSSKTDADLLIDDLVDKLKKNRASVFVGAGFSFNANRIDGSDIHMASWNEISDEFCKKLGKDPLDNMVRYENPLELAQEVEVLYGKPYLNCFIRDYLDDDSYEPGLAHKLLVSLPWNDIFTTNYDTLLERAYLADTKRNYKVVNNKNDLLYSGGSPRIIKLHGSFPSHEPFIISDEDYRRYPLDNASFVNTVQQSLLENLMVLIGFSGSDPNFKKWIGWIHDNLGKINSPKIYMIVLDSSTLNTRVMASKNIEIIDLKKTAYFNKNNKLCIEQFLKAISDRLTSSNEFSSWPFVDGNFQFSLDLSLDQILSNLKRIHESYPGWFTVKVGWIKNVDYIILSIISFIRKEIVKKTFDKKIIDIIYELVWLCNISGFIADYRVTNDILEIIKENNDTSSNEKITYIKLFILKCYRVNGDSGWYNLYNELKDKNKSLDKNSDLFFALRYEYAMQMLYSFNWHQLESSVNLIPVNYTKPEFIIKKIGLLASLGKLEEALILIKETLKNVRKILLYTDRDNYQVYNRFSSLNNTLISLFEYVKQADFISSSNNENDNGNDNEKNIPDNNTNVSDYIWSLENDKFSNLFSSSYSPRPIQETKSCFDLNYILHECHYSPDYDCIYSMQFILFRENTGHPFRIGYLTEKKGLLGAISRLNWTATRTPFVNAIISGDAELIDVAFSRKELAFVNCNFINRLCKDLIHLIALLTDDDEWIKYDRRKGFSILYTTFDVVLESISRLTVKCDETSLDTIIELLQKILNNEIIVRRLFVNYKGLKNLIKRTIELMQISQIEKNLNKFWRFNIVSYELDVFFYLQQRISRYGKKYKLDALKKKAIYELIDNCSDIKKKLSFLPRLLCVYRIYEFDKKLNVKLGKLIWNGCDPSINYTLPDMVCFSNVAAIDFPYVIEDKLLRKKTVNFLFRKYLNVIKEQDVRKAYDLFIDFELFINKFKLTFCELKALCRVVLKLSVFLISKFPIRNNDYLKSVEYESFVSPSLCMVDPLLGDAFLKEGLKNTKNSYILSNLEKIVSIFQENGIPSSFMSWFLSSQSYKKEWEYGEIYKSYLCLDHSFLNNANQTVSLLNRYNQNIDISIINLIFYSVVFSTHYNIVEFVNCLALLVKKELIDKKKILITCSSLSKIDDFTKIDCSDNEDVVIKKIKLRKACCYLAKCLDSWFEINNEKVLNSIIYWKEKIAKNQEEFAEIRLVYELC